MRHYDYLIVGGGCAGLSLAWQLLSACGQETRILILDRDAKKQDDRSWACWTAGDLPLGLDAIVHHRWSNLAFATASFTRRQALHPYTYQLIRGIDYYDFMRQRLSACPQVEWVIAEVEAVGQNAEAAWVCAGEETFTGAYLFDSRPQLAHADTGGKAYFLWQHFHGIRIRTTQTTFDADTATLMDFRAIPAGQTAFFYVLPFSAHEALVEFTAFSAQVAELTYYEAQLRRYCEQVLGLADYEVLSTETGQIPMTNRALYPEPQGRIHPIGTAAACVKPTTG
ncbi:MAG: FAD-dependent oxidoreductase, partial [Bacteroidetes bacterium]